MHNHYLFNRIYMDLLRIRSISYYRSNEMKCILRESRFTSTVCRRLKTVIEFGRVENGALWYTIGRVWEKWFRRVGNHQIDEDRTVLLTHFQEITTFNYYHSNRSTDSFCVWWSLSISLCVCVHSPTQASENKGDFLSSVHAFGC